MVWNDDAPVKKGEIRVMLPDENQNNKVDILIKMEVINRLKHLYMLQPGTVGLTENEDYILYFHQEDQWEGT